MNQEMSHPASVIPVEFKCPVCKNDLRELEPKLLPCLHTICSRCLPSETAENTGFCCAVCRQEYRLDEVILNQFIKDNVTPNENVADEMKEPVCTSCDDNEVATSYCGECSEWLCDACVQAHQRVRITKDHAIQTKEEAMVEQNSVLSQKMLFCQIHKQEQLKLFCETCDLLTCRDCQLGEHREHRYQFISEASHQHKLYLETLLHKLRDKKKHMEAAKMLITKRYKEISEREMSVTSEIRAFAIRFITEINKRGKKLLSELHDVCASKKTALGYKNNELSVKTARLDHCLKFVEKAIDQSSDTALLFSKRCIINQLRNVLHSHCEVPNPNHNVDIRFMSPNESFSQYIEQMGCLFVDNSPYKVRQSVQPVIKHSYSSMAAMANMKIPSVPVQNKSMAMGMFNSPVNPSHPHVVSSSTHPMDFQRNIRLRNLLEQSAPIPPQMSRPGGNYFHSPPVPGDSQPSTLAQKNSALFNILMNNPAARSETLSSAAAMTNLRMPSLTPIAQGMNPHLGQNWSSVNQQLSNTQRLSHYPLSSTSTLPISPSFDVVNATTQESYTNSPQNMLNSPGQSGLSNIQISNIISQLLPPTTSLKDGQKNGEKTKPEIVSANQRMKQEGSGPFAACSMSNVKIKQEVIDDAKEIAATAQKALNLYCNGNLNNFMGASNDQDSEVEIIASNSPRNKEGKCEKTFKKLNNGQDKDNNELDKGGTVQQADSSCSPGLIALDCNLNDASIDSIPSIKDPIKCPASAGKTINNLQESQDPNDDWCAVCHDGGDLLCCGQCPRVYHLGCHIPSLSEFPGQEDQWQCLMCRNQNELYKYIVKENSQNPKRKNCVGLNGNDLRMCERILLELFCYEQSYSFHHPVSRAEAPDYHKIITNPMDLGTIKKKLSPCHFNHYEDTNEMLEDVKLVFKNCYTYNGPDSQVYKAGQLLEELFKTLVSKYMPSYSNSIDGSAEASNKPEDNDIQAKDDGDLEPETKKKKLDFIIW